MLLNGLLDQHQMTNKGQMKAIFRKINQEISMHYFYIERNNQEIYEMHSDWNIHPSDKHYQITRLKNKNLFMTKEIQRLKETKIIISTG